MVSPITLTGTVARNAEARRTADGETMLSFDFAVANLLALRPVQVRVLKSYGMGEAANVAARHRAARLRLGVRVTAVGGGLHLARGVLMLQAVQEIDEPDLTLRNITGEAAA